jgi:hypothetical protein
MSWYHKEDSMSGKKHKADDTERFWPVLVGNYILDCLELLDDEAVELLEAGSRGYGIEDWRAEAKKMLMDRYSISDSGVFFQKSYHLVLDYLVEGDATEFILRGMECPSCRELCLLREQYAFGQL